MRYPSYTMVVPTAYGQMIALRTDSNQFGALVKTGEAPEGKIVTAVAKLLGTKGRDNVIVDAGANFGCYSLALHEIASVVHAFEPQRIILNCLAGSVALNSIENIHLHNVALGDREGMIDVPKFDYSQEMNFGSVEFGEEQEEKLAQARGVSTEQVQVRTLDSYNFQRLDFLKIDVEGMEAQVLTGAKETVMRTRPLMLIENLKGSRLNILYQLDTMGYMHKDVPDNFLAIPLESPWAVK